MASKVDKAAAGTEDHLAIAASADVGLDGQVRQAKPDVEPAATPWRSKLAVTLLFEL